MQAGKRNSIGLSKSSRITRALERKIRTGEISHGDRLESESTLMQRFSVSRNTVRKGLEALVRQGLITTRSGIGSFVTYDDKQINNDLGWTLALSQGDDNVDTRLLQLQRGGCARTRDLLSLDNDFLCIDRLRLDVNSERGLSLERSRLPWRDCYAIMLETGLQNQSLSQTLAQLRVVVASGEEWAGVLCALPENDSVVMQREVGEPMLQLRRLTRDAEGAVVEFVDSILDPERFGLHLEF